MLNCWLMACMTTVVSNWKEWQTLSICYCCWSQIQGIHKGVVWFQKLTRNLFLTLHGHNVHRQQRQLSKFRMRYQQVASHAYCGSSFQDGIAAGKGVLCAPFLGVQICDYSARNSRCTVITEHTESLFLLRHHIGNWPRSKHEKRTADSAWETWTVAAADGVRCARVRWEINFLLTSETTPFFWAYPVFYGSSWRYLNFTYAEIHTL